MMDVTEAATVEIKYLSTLALKFTLILFVFWFYLWNREHMYLVWKSALSLIAKALLSADSGILRCLFSRNSTNRQPKWLLIKKSCVANLMFEQRSFFFENTDILHDMIYIPNRQYRYIVVCLVLYMKYLEAVPILRPCKMLTFWSPFCSQFQYVKHSIHTSLSYTLFKVQSLSTFSLFINSAIKLIL